MKGILIFMILLALYEVTTLVNKFKQAGRYTASFDASRLSSGVYLYKFVSGKYTAVKKMILLR